MHLVAHTWHACSLRASLTLIRKMPLSDFLGVKRGRGNKATTYKMTAKPTNPSPIACCAIAGGVVSRRMGVVSRRGGVLMGVVSRRVGVVSRRMTVFPVLVLLVNSMPLASSQSE